MSELDVLIKQMVSDLSTQAFQLEERCLRLFLNWLMDHSSDMKHSLGAFDADPGSATLKENFQSALKTWLQSLPAQGLLWEYQTIIGEICWWRDLDPSRWKMIVRSDAEE